MSSLLFGSASSAPAFETIGQTLELTVTAEPRDVQRRNFVTKELEFYKDGNPKMQVVFTGTTSLRDPSIEGDSGMRSLYAKDQMLTAIRKAMQAAGCTQNDHVVGGKLTVKFLRTEPKPGNDQKIYGAKFERSTTPVAQSATEDGFEI